MLREPDLFRAHGVPHVVPAHVPQEHELRRAYQSAKQLCEQLEVANLRTLYRLAVGIREEVFLELLHVNGVHEVVE